MTHGAAQGDPVIAAAGDIACDPSTAGFSGNQWWVCQMRATANLMMGMELAAVLPLGDLQYENGTLQKFQQSYHPSWGRFKAMTRPVPGNHEYGTRGAQGYFAYFGEAAGDPERGYYSYDIGAWHLIALNSNCGAVGGCGAGSPQERWLRADLAANPAKCTLAYWHHPRFSSGYHGTNAAYTAFWRALHEADADIVLNGHDHDYERFAPKDPAGRVDPGRGIRQFVVGTGGRSLYGLRRPEDNSVIFSADAFGILLLALHPAGYEWKFVPVAGKEFTDSGRGNCH
ncbi:MAG TPA: metallophosphoesterase [bacterium]|nr:metallophosphoesterase [bacterium]